MAETTNIRIITDLGELSYSSVESLGITFNRVADDFQDISNRFQDFSYDFELPYTKENSQVFGAPEALGGKGYFVVNRSIPCKVYLNNELLLDGLINLDKLTKSGYKCTFYSKFKELIDILNESNADGNDKTLRDLKFPVVTGWTYEESIVTHIAANYKDCTETFYQFPLCHYSTFYCEYGLYSGLTDTLSRPPYSLPFKIDYTRQNFYYLFNTNLSGDVANNRYYVHQIPPAVYIVSIIEQILSDAGWKLGGQFFNNDSIRKVILTYAGDDDIYDQATEIVSGSTALNLQIAKFLPEWSQSDFLMNIINLFNLYIRVDVSNKIVVFDTYNTIFGSTYNPYDITDRVDKQTLEFYYEDQNDPSILFEKANNQKIFGDDKVMSGCTTNATSTVWTACDGKAYNTIFNHVGTTDDIKLDFSEPNIQRVFIWNDIDVDGAWKYGGAQTIYMPCLTKATPTDNDGKKFSSATGDTYLNNNEGTVKFAGKPSLMYYYGRPLNEFENKTGKGYLSKFMYFNIYTDTGNTRNAVPLNVCSPFQLFNYRDKVDNWLSGVTTANINDRRTAVCSYLQGLWQIMGQNHNLPNTVTTDFSLVFDDSEFHETLWTKFHKDKWDNYKYSEMLSAEMRMSPIDWREMQLDRPIMYNNEIYNLVQIENYDPIKRIANITLNKKR